MGRPAALRTPRSPPVIVAVYVVLIGRGSAEAARWKTIEFVLATYVIVPVMGVTLPCASSVKFAALVIRPPSIGSLETGRPDARWVGTFTFSGTGGRAVAFGVTGLVNMTVGAVVTTGGR